MWSASAAALALAAVAGAIVWFGAGDKGIEVSLRLTARLMFLLFWPGYVGGALQTLFGAAFASLRARARALGLAFATVLGVHLALVAWRSAIGHAPSLGTFLLFGPPAAAAGLLALASIERVAQALGPRGAWLRTIGATWIAFAFAVDFLRLPRGPLLLGVVEYAPFAALAVLGPALRLAAWAKLRFTAG